MLTNNKKNKTQDLLDPSEIGSLPKRRSKKVVAEAPVKDDPTKYVRLVQIAFMILGTLLLVKQDFLYAQIMGVASAITTGERIWQLVFRGK